MGIFAAGSIRWAGVAFLAAGVTATAQTWDLGAAAGAVVSSQTEGKLKLTFEQRGRYERRTGQSFGSAPDLETGLLRTRIGVLATPFSWLRFGTTFQDSRSPWYGANAPSSVRDPFDLFESYFEIFPSSKTGWGATAGRKMLNYGDTRLIGSPQWGNLSRSFDHARVYYRLPGAQFEFLVVSPVKVRIGEFNRPVLGDRVWGMYNSFKGPFPKGVVEVYVLRHDQNRPAGFTGGKTQDGTDRLKTNTFGGRISGQIQKTTKYTFEAALQNGRIGAAGHRAGAFVSTFSRPWAVGGRNVTLTGEYKYASGTSDPSNPNRVGTFDQLYPSGHDKFGHQDLFGWRNLHNLRSVATLPVTKSFSVSAMYNSLWLASVRDGLYNGSGKSIARSINGTAGRHVGQEADIFATYKYQHFQFGAGYGYLFKGEFIRNATPGVNPSYAYVFHSYSF